MIFDIGLVVGYVLIGIIVANFFKLFQLETNSWSRGDEGSQYIIGTFWPMTLTFFLLYFICKKFYKVQAWIVQELTNPQDNV